MILLLIEKIYCSLIKRRVLRSCINKPQNLMIQGSVKTGNVKLDLGDNVVLYPNVTFSGNGVVKIGDNSKIGQDCILYSHQNGGIKIGDNTIIAGQTYIIDSNHSVYLGELIKDQPLKSAEIRIGSDVWIAANCTIIKGATLEDGVVVGAKSLVNSRLIKNGIYAGSPAKLIKDRIQKVNNDENT